MDGTCRSEGLAWFLPFGFPAKTMTARSALHEATALIARAKRRQSNKVSRSPQRPAGEPNMAAGGFLAFAGGTEARAKKTKEAAMRKRKERKRHDKLARYEQPAGRTALFYTLKNRHVIKMGWTAWRDFCRLTMTNTAFPDSVRWVFSFLFSFLFLSIGLFQRVEQV